MPPPPPPPPVAPSSIHPSDNTSIIKQKINSRPMTGEEYEDYLTTKKVIPLHFKCTLKLLKEIKRE
jgi:hypothetical protein